MKYVNSSEPNMSLVFPDNDLYEQYCHERRALHDKYKNLVRDKYGIWASNQNKFVKNVKELNDFDSRGYV